MNLDLWHRHLATRNAQLEREVQRLRVLLTTQRRRAETWRHRALRKRP